MLNRLAVLLPAWSRPALGVRADRTVQATARTGGQRQSPKFVVSLLILLGVVSGCRATSKPPTVGLPERHTVTAEQLLVRSDLKLPRSHPLLKELEALRTEIARVLDLPVQEQPVTVYLFEDEVRYAQYFRTVYPTLPPRRAYFVGTSKELAVFTYWGDRIQEDLRHEYTHGVLHASLKDVPLWLDEGLAEYFEVAEGPPGFNKDYASKLGTALANGWRPDLDRLESLASVEQMQKADYFEAWVWVHFLLHDSEDSRGVLLDYLRELRMTAKPGPLSTRLAAVMPQAADRFLSYAGTLSQGPIAASAVAPPR